MNNCNYAVRPIILIFFSLIIGMCTGITCGYLIAQPEETSYRLQITEETGLGFRNVTSEELGGNYDGITYVDVAEATITLDGKTMLLEHAIRDGLVTVEQIIAQAQEDARNNECVLKYSSNMGISDFIYSYRDQYDLMVRYDVFECSDGKQNFLSAVTVTPYRKSKDVSIGFTQIDEDGNLFNPLYEDWGLVFTASKVSPTHMELNYTQLGGMSVGELSVKWFHLLSDKGMIDEPHELTMEPIPIEKNTTGTFSISWESLFGELPPGEYSLLLYVYDTYDENEIHPLIRKYCYGQYYTIPFTVS